MPPPSRTSEIKTNQEMGMETPQKIEVPKTPSTKITMSATANSILFGVSTIGDAAKGKHGFDAQELDTPLTKRRGIVRTQRRPKEYSR